MKLLFATILILLFCMPAFAEERECLTDQNTAGLEEIAEALESEKDKSEAESTTAENSNVSWYDHTDVNKAKEESIKTGKPILHVFDYVGSGCTYCEWMRTNIYPNPEVKELFSKYIVVHRVMNNLKNSIEESKIEKKYGIKRYPSHQFESFMEISPGKYGSIMWGKFEGWQYKDDFINTLQDIMPNPDGNTLKK